MKLSEIYGKEAVSRDGKHRGWVRGVLGNGSTPQFLQCFDGDEKEFDIDIKDVTYVGEKIVFDDRTEIKRGCRNMRLGLPAYDEAGKFLGHLSDLESGKDGLFYYLIGKKKYRPEFVAVGDAVIVRAPRTLKENVTSGGAVILKKGTPLTPEALKKAEEAGEYFQAQFKSI